MTLVRTKSKNCLRILNLNPGSTRVGGLIFVRYNMEYKFVRYWIISILSLKTHLWRLNEQINENMACMSLHMVSEFDWRRSSLWEFSCFPTRLMNPGWDHQYDLKHKCVLSDGWAPLNLRKTFTDVFYKAITSFLWQYPRCAPLKLFL